MTRMDEIYQLIQDAFDSMALYGSEVAPIPTNPLLNLGIEIRKTQQKILDAPYKGLVKMDKVNNSSLKQTTTESYLIVPLYAQEVVAQIKYGTRLLPRDLIVVGGGSKFAEAMVVVDMGTEWIKVIRAVNGALEQLRGWDLAISPLFHDVGTPFKKVCRISTSDQLSYLNGPSLNQVLNAFPERYKPTNLPDRIELGPSDVDDTPKPAPWEIIDQPNGMGRAIDLDD